MRTCKLEDTELLYMKLKLSEWVSFVSIIKTNLKSFVEMAYQTRVEFKCQG
jgi:hypothetical protein